MEYKCAYSDNLFIPIFQGSENENMSIIFQGSQNENMSIIFQGSENENMSTTENAQINP